MKAFRNLPVFVIFLIILDGCSPVLYSNVGQNVPLLQNKGEFSAQLALATVDGPDGVAVQSAYAISDHVGVMTSLYLLGDHYAEGWKGTGSYFEFGGGYFTKTGTQKLVFEIYGGAGFGSIKNQDNTSRQFVDVSFSKPFVQPSIGFTSKYFDVAITPRFGKINYGKTSQLILDPIYVDELASYLSRFDGDFFFEPGITLRGGFQNVKLQVQYVYSTYAKETWVCSGFFSVGVNFLISEKRYPSNQLAK